MDRFYYQTLVVIYYQITVGNLLPMVYKYSKIKEATIFNKLILKKYADTYNFTIEEVEAECKNVLDIMQMYKYYDGIDCIKFIEDSLNIKIRDKERNHV